MKKWYLIEGKNAYESKYIQVVLILQSIFGKAIKIRIISISNSSVERIDYHILDYINHIYVFDCFIMNEFLSIAEIGDSYTECKEMIVGRLNIEIGYEKTTTIEWYIKNNKL